MPNITSQTAIFGHFQTFKSDEKRIAVHRKDKI